MTAGKQKIETDGYSDHTESMRYYTADESANRLLNEYTRCADKESVWISIDGEGFRNNVLGEDFCRLLSLALSQSLETCVMTTPPKKRYLKVRSMNTQNKVFVKIRYSCEEPVMVGFDRRYHTMQEMLERADGYMRLQFGEDENILKIAVPV